MGLEKQGFWMDGYEDAARLRQSRVILTACGAIRSDELVSVIGLTQAEIDGFAFPDDDHLEYEGLQTARARRRTSQGLTA